MVSDTQASWCTWWRFWGHNEEEFHLTKCNQLCDSTQDRWPGEPQNPGWNAEQIYLMISLTGGSQSNTQAETREWEHHLWFPLCILWLHLSPKTVSSGVSLGVPPIFSKHWCYFYTGILFLKTDRRQGAVGVMCGVSHLDIFRTKVLPAGRSPEGIGPLFTSLPLLTLSSQHESIWCLSLKLWHMPSVHNLKQIGVIFLFVTFP